MPWWRNNQAFVLHMSCSTLLFLRGEANPLVFIKGLYSLFLPRGECCSVASSSNNLVFSELITQSMCPLYGSLMGCSDSVQVSQLYKSSLSTKRCYEINTFFFISIVKNVRAGNRLYKLQWTLKHFNTQLRTFHWSSVKGTISDTFWPPCTI